MRVAYVLSRFPTIVETFILREIIELETLGVEVRIFPIILEKNDVKHQESRKLMPQVRYIPYLSFNVAVGNVRIFLKNPWLYLKVFFILVKENLSGPKFLSRAMVIFPKAVIASEVVSREKIDHIHAHFGTHAATYAWIMSQFTGIPYSITLHAHDIFNQKTMLKRKMDDASFLVTISDYNVHYIEEKISPKYTDKINIVRCGVYLDQYQTRPDRSLQGRPFEIINVARLKNTKGHKFLIEACTIMKKSGIPFRVRLVGEGEERKNIEKSIAAMDLAGQFELVGFVPQDKVPGLLSQSDCYVQPSLQEGIPVAIMEALAVGLPVVATNLSGIPELVENNVTGYLVEPASAEELAQAILGVYQNYAESLALANKGRERVINQYDIRKNARNLLGLFNQTSQQK